MKRTVASAKPYFFGNLLRRPVCLLFLIHQPHPWRCPAKDTMPFLSLWNWNATKCHEATKTTARADFCVLFHLYRHEKVFELCNGSSVQGRPPKRFPDLCTDLTLEHHMQQTVIKQQRQDSKLTAVTCSTYLDMRKSLSLATPWVCKADTQKVSSKLCRSLKCSAILIACCCSCFVAAPSFLIKSTCMPSMTQVQTVA